MARKGTWCGLSSSGVVRGGVTCKHTNRAQNWAGRGMVGQVPVRRESAHRFLGDG
jgi:hypothetical protein